MAVKKDDMKFSIRLSPLNPTHVQVAEMLNQQSWRGKAQYIVDAVLHYESCGKTMATGVSLPGDGISISSIEAVVRRMLSGKKKPVSLPEDKVGHHEANSTAADILYVEPVTSEVSVETDPGDLGAIAITLESFRRKR